MSQSTERTETRFDEADASSGGSSGSRAGTDTDLPLLPDEEVLIDAKPTWWAFGSYLGAAALVTLLGLAIAVAEPVAGVSVALVGLAVAGYAWYQRARLRYLVTDRRVVVIAGLLARTTTETWMEDVRGMRTSASQFERRRGFGTITVAQSVQSDAFGRMKGLRLVGIPDYEAVADVIRRRQSERKAGEY